MPQFIGRPNLPNQLANSLVQLAVAETDPLAVGLNQIGKIADTVTDQQLRMKMLEKQFALDEAKADKQHGRAKELAKQSSDQDILKMILGNSKIVDGLMGGNMTAGDAEALAGDSMRPSGPLGLMGGQKQSFGAKKSAPAKQGKGRPLSSVGVNIPGDPSFVNEKDSVEIDAAMAKKFGLPDSTIGKSLTMDQVISLRRNETTGSNRAGRDPQKLKLAEQIVNRNPDMIEASLEERMAAIDIAYDSLGTINAGGKIEAPKSGKTEVVEKKKGLWGSIFNFGGGAKEAAPAEAASTPGSKMTREERIKRLKAKGLGG